MPCTIETASPDIGVSARHSSPAAPRRTPESQVSASTPTDSIAARGQEVFLASTCVMCHAIGGTPAGSRVGPNLTHLASRRTIGAGSLPNTRGNLAGWIVDPQGVKPGVRMPPNAIEPDDLQALLVYLEGLQ